MRKFRSDQANTLFKSAMLAALLLLFLPESGLAESPSFVSFGLAAGAAGAPDVELKSNPSQGEVDLNTGYSLRASLGFLFNENLGLEGEYLYTSHGIPAVINPPVTTTLFFSDRIVQSVMVSALYRIETPPSGDVDFKKRGYYTYLGGGVGISWQDYTIESLANGQDSSLSWQVLIGFEKMFPARYLFAALPSPFLQYRFLRINEGDFGAFKADASIHIIEFGFRFYGAVGK